MLPWALLDRAAVPDAGGELTLHQRGDELSIRLVGHGELMNSRQHGSEEALAEQACARLRGRAAPRVLIGGLGMGFTLAAALRHLGPAADVVVAELVPAVVAWNRGPLGPAAGHPLADPRVTVFEGDVAAQLAAAQPRYDAILLDVDNGPEGLTRAANDALYQTAGLRRFRAALRPGGVLGVWSAGPAPEFVRRLQTAGFAVEEARVPARGKKGTRHFIWLAVRLR